MADFVHLHTHSEYSLLDGLGKLPELVARAKELGMDALALTDHGAMYGSFKFYLEAKKAGIKPIIGVEAYVSRRRRHDKEARVDADPYHLVLLAKNEQGYRNLMKLVTIAHLEGFYYKPRIDWELLTQYHDGLICLSACLHGEVPSLLLREENEEAETVARRYSDLFGPDHYYIELQKHPKIPEQDLVNEKLVALAKKLGLPIVATNDIHYVSSDDAEAQDILLCVQTGKTVLDRDRGLTMIDSPDFYMRSPEEMQDLFAQYPEATKNTARIAAMCDISLSVGKWILPKYPIPQDETPDSYLRTLVEEGAMKKYTAISGELRERIDYELDIIQKKGYATYFLIVSDFVNWAKDRGIAVGPGRGSAAGSVVSYSLNITGIDPLYFSLPFERFLNPFRPSPPDIDLDFADDRRDEVIAYVTDKYGSDKVAQIITFGTMEARGAIRDAGRALGMPYAQPDRIARMIPPGVQGFGMSIDRALEQSAELALAYRTEPETKRLLDVAKKLEGVARHASVHAAGVVIADKPIVEYTPVQKETRGEKIVTQYDMYTVGEDGVGLLKMDFLGLRNLTIMSRALELIKNHNGKDVDLSAIPLNDEKTYTMLSEGETTGIFQLESAGMRRYVKELKPTSLFDLMAMVALFRPGPMAVIPEFIRRKNNPELISYPDPRLTDVLKTSYGLICYQDDVLLTSIALAGYTWEEADKLRKAVGKKIPAEMQKQKIKFVKGCVDNGLPQKRAEEIFALIEPFAGYGFNKAHAACYATIAYQTGYLKANFPVAFMTAVLTAESRANTGATRDQKMADAVDECVRMGISLLPPDINASVQEFSIEGNNIRFGLSAVKNVGEAAIDTMLHARKRGPFLSLSDFTGRVDLSKVNRKTLESLIKCGALDAFGSRAALLTALPTIMAEVQKQKKIVSTGQSGLFDTQETALTDDALPEVEELPTGDLLAFEKELLGLYLTAHPMERAMKQLLENGFTKINQVRSSLVGTRIKIGGIVVRSKKITTKSSGKEMAFVTIEDTSGPIELVVFPKIYAQTIELWQQDTMVQVSGKVDQKDDRISFLVDDARKIFL